MPENQHLKSARNDYNPDPFYFFEENETFKRYVVYNPFYDVIKNIFIDIISNYNSEIEILLKDLKDYDETGKKDIIWDHYYTKTTKDKILEALDVHSKYIFYDGYQQLCIRDSITEDYFAFDDHGILFIYSENKLIEDILKKYKIKNSKNELILEKPHWHIRPKDADDLKISFIKDLKIDRSND